MPSLVNKTTCQVLAENVTRLETFLERLKGLIGKEETPSNSTFWISACPSIHTFFMKFSLDVIFTDKNFKIVSVFHSVPPGKILFGGRKSYHVFEMQAPGLKSHSVKKGDILNVGH